MSHEKYVVEKEYKIKSFLFGFVTILILAGIYTFLYFSKNKTALLMNVYTAIMAVIILFFIINYIILFRKYVLLDDYLFTYYKGYGKTVEIASDKIVKYYVYDKTSSTKYSTETKTFLFCEYLDQNDKYSKMNMQLYWTEDGYIYDWFEKNIDKSKLSIIHKLRQKDKKFFTN